MPPIYETTPIKNAVPGTAQGLAALMSPNPHGGVQLLGAADAAAGVASVLIDNRLSTPPGVTPKVRVLGCPSVKNRMTLRDCVSFMVTICWYPAQNAAAELV